MAVDPSKLKKLGRRRLGLPPTDGSPGIEESAAKHGEALASDPQSQAGVGRHASPEVERTSDPYGLSTAPEPPLAWSGAAESIPEERGGAWPESEAEEAAKARRIPSKTARAGGEQNSFQRGHRVPPPPSSHGFRSQRGSPDPRKNVLRTPATTCVGDIKTSLTRRLLPI